MNEGLSKLEVSVAALSGLIVFIATMTGPRLSHGVSRDGLAIVNARQERQITELEAALATVQERGEALDTQLAEACLQVEQVRSELAAMTEQRDALDVQLAASAEKVGALEAKLRTADEEATKLKELLSLHEVTQERDTAKAREEEAKARAEKAEERIRELTLQLHRAGLWP